MTALRHLTIFLCLATPAGLAAGSRLKTKIGRALASTALRGATVGVHIARLDDGRTVYSQHASKALTLASNTKVFTSAAALHHLGADFEFNTYVMRDGQVGDDGAVQGNIVIVGDGDPNVSGRHFDGDVTAIFKQCAAIIKEQGITRVTGDVVADDRIFDRESLRPKVARYTSPVSGLPFNDNRIDVLVSPTRAGAAASVTTEPATEYVAISSRIRTSSNRKRDVALFSVGPKDNAVKGTGYVFAKSPRRRYRVALVDPGLYFATVLKETLVAAGIAVDGEPRLPRDDENFESLAELAKMSSGLDITLPVLNKKSDNFYADTLLKRIGAKIAGQGTYASGAQAVAQFLDETGAPKDGAQFSDGCGLSRDNAASPRTVTHVLRHVAASDGSELFRESLAVSGEDGTLSRRMSKSQYRGKVQAKTGYIKRVSALSGYAEGKSGTTYVFSIIMNGFRATNGQMKDVQDAICRAIVSEG